MKRLCPILLAFAAFAASALDPVPLSVSPLALPDAVVRPSAESPAAILLALPEESGFRLHAPAPEQWVTLDALRFALVPATNAPANLQMLVQVTDWEGAWFQFLRRDFLLPGETNLVDIPVGPDAPGWEPLGHPGAWNRRSLLLPAQVRVCLFANGATYSGEVSVALAEGLPSDDTAPPFIRHVRPTDESSAETPVDGRYELRFEIPDRYANPFDTDQIAVDAEIATPSGTLTVPCFYYQDCLRLPTATEERILPQGRPEWRLRFSPNEEGPHTIALVARDRFGETRLPDAAAFTATAPADGTRTVRISKRDPRYFEDDAGRPFFLIGYNIRSPYDARMDVNFPTLFRHPEGTTSYARRFRQMAENGLNIAEIWSSAWCMGLEWSPLYPGYHGIGQFNLRNAWERDRVFAVAAENGIQINMVLNNHGRLSSFCDPEWNDNPYNAATQPGGWYQDPMQWFADERARVQYEKQLRYEIARYSWNANLFAWELWSELDLTGKGGDNSQAHPVVHDWHRRMAAYLHAHDPKRHLVSTHTSSDYTRMDPGLAAIQELDHVCGDAYHGSQDTLHICNLMFATKQQPHLQNRATLITEFGGTPNAAAISHLRRETHAALWDALPSGLAGAPMLWWWHVVEEYDFFPMYAAFSRFVQGEDYIDPELRPGHFGIPTIPPAPSEALPAPPPVVADMALSPTRGYVWIHVMNDRYPLLDPAGDPVHQGYRIQIPFPGRDDAVYTFEFWDTVRGEPVRLQDARVRQGVAEVSIPPFARDIAAKIHLADRETADEEAKEPQP